MDLLPRGCWVQHSDAQVGIEIELLALFDLRVTHAYHIVPIFNI